MLVDLVVMALLILANGYFSLSEMALVSARTARLKELSLGKGSLALGAATALALKERPGRFLSTVQIGITLIGIYAGAFGGTQLSAPLADLIDTIPALNPWADEIALALVVLLITFFSLLLGELIPKNLALAMPEGIAIRISRPMRLLMTLLTPGVFILDRVSAAVLKLFGRDGSNTEKVTEDEIRYLVSEGAAAGAIERHERDMIYRIIRLGDKTAGDIMIPRPMMKVLDIDAPLEENLAVLRATAHSRLPVIRGDSANVVGFIAKSDLMLRAIENAQDLFRTMRVPLYVPEMTPAVRLIELLQSSDFQFAIVVDEYGTSEGVVTLADVLTAIVGDATGLAREGGATEICRDDGSFLVDGLKPAEDLKDLLGLKSLPAEGLRSYNTVAGMIIAQFGDLPAEGQSFDFQGWRFEVVDLDGQRIDKVLIAKI